MDHGREDLTRALAAALSHSTTSPHDQTLESWLAAEQMVTQSLRAHAVGGAADATGLGGDDATRCSSLASPAFPVAAVRELAHLFWEHSAPTTPSAAPTLDIWLAAERHVLALCRATLAGADGSMHGFSAATYWQRIRDRAERLWEADGRPAGRDLDLWLRAEDEVLAAATGVAPAAGRAGRDRDGSCRGDKHPTARPPLALSILARDDAAPAPAWVRSASAFACGAPLGL